MKTINNILKKEGLREKQDIFDYEIVNGKLFISGNNQELAKKIHKLLKENGVTSTISKIEGKLVLLFST